MQTHTLLNPVSVFIPIMRVKDLYEGYLEMRAKEGKTLKTINEDKRFLFGAILQSVGDRDLNSLNLVMRGDLMQAGQKHGIYGSQRTVVCFRQLMQYAKMLGLKIPFDWRDIKTPRVPQKRVEYLSPDEMERIRECFPVNGRRDMPKLRSRALIEFMLGTGLRIGEACSVNIKDINWDSKEMRFMNIKTKEEETMNLNDNVIGWLKMYLLERERDAFLKGREDDCPALFTSGRARLLPGTSRGFIRLKTKKLGLNKRIAHHVFRRTCGTYLLQDGTNIKSVQDYLRHKSERTTLRYYIGLEKENRREVATKAIGKFVLAPTSM